MLSDERADAGVLYTLIFNLDNGHTFIPVEKLTHVVCTLLSDDDVVFDEERALASIDRLAASGKLVREHIAGRDAVYLPGMPDAETYLADKMCIRDRPSTATATTSRRSISTDGLPQPYPYKMCKTGEC